MGNGATLRRQYSRPSSTLQTGRPTRIGEGYFPITPFLVCNRRKWNSVAQVCVSIREVCMFAKLRFTIPILLACISITGCYRPYPPSRLETECCSGCSSLVGRVGWRWLDLLFERLSRIQRLHDMGRGRTDIGSSSLRPEGCPTRRKYGRAEIYVPDRRSHRTG